MDLLARTQRIHVHQIRPEVVGQRGQGTHHRVHGQVEGVAGEAVLPHTVSSKFDNAGEVSQKESVEGSVQKLKNVEMILFKE